MTKGLHLAIIMDGNGRWAQAKGMPRSYGHTMGVKSVKKIIKYCHAHELKELTLFAMSSENMKRPFTEVGFLVDLFGNELERQIQALNQQNIRLKIIGNLSEVGTKFQDVFRRTEELTSSNTGMKLNVCFNYSGRWHIEYALKEMLNQKSKGIDDFEKIMFKEISEPDFIIRTGGEKRISNFLLYHMAYSELYFTSTLWPDFDELGLEAAFKSYSGRQRRYGLSEESIES